MLYDVHISKHQGRKDEGEWMNTQALKDALAERDMSQNELARKVGCSCGQMSNIVNGRREPRTDLFKLMCDALRKKPQKLL